MRIVKTGDSFILIIGYIHVYFDAVGKYESGYIDLYSINRLAASLHLDDANKFKKLWGEI